MVSSVEQAAPARAPTTDARPTAAKALHLPTLDGLRFFAFFWVFWHHVAQYAGPLPDVAIVREVFQRSQLFGWAGVDLFLVLSAYLITRLLVQEHAVSGTIRVPAFYVRRMLRIWPLYFLSILCGFVVFPVLGVWGPSWGAPEHVEMAQRFLVPYTLLSGNLAVSVYGYPAATVLSALWTVSLEEQFYLVWPLMLRAMIRMSPSRRAAILGGFWAFSVVARLVAIRTGRPHFIIWANTFCRLDPLVLGAAAGLASAHWLPARLNRLLQPARSYAMPLVGVLLLVVAGAHTNIQAQGRWQVIQYAVTAVAMTCLVLSAVGSMTAVQRVLSQPALTWLGKVSYGLYVMHPCAIAAVDAWFSSREPSFAAHPAMWAASVGAAFGMTVVAAAVSYRWFEKPFLALKERFTVVASRAP